MNKPAPHEQTVSLTSKANVMHGTLTLPVNTTDEESDNQQQALKAAVLLLADSGALDRNQNSIQAQLNIFNDMAIYLAELGIATVRYDKRGCGMSKGNFDKAGHSDLVDDAQAWLDYLQSDSPIAGSAVFVLGHGEGSLIASRLCIDNDYIKGQILLMPFVEDYELIIRRQAELALRDIAALEGFRGKLIRFFVRLGGDQIAKQKKLIQKIRKTRRDTLRIRKQLINAKWIREMIDIDAATIHQKVSAPTLIIGGEKDLQCLPGDVEKIAALVKGPVQWHVFDDLTHILRPDPQAPSVQHYLKLTLEDVDRRVLNTVAQWLHDQQISAVPLSKKGH